MTLREADCGAMIRQHKIPEVNGDQSPDSITADIQALLPP